MQCLCCSVRHSHICNMYGRRIADLEHWIAQDLLGTGARLSDQWRKIMGCVEAR